MQEWMEQKKYLNNGREHFIKKNDRLQATHPGSLENTKQVKWPNKQMNKFSPSHYHIQTVDNKREKILKKAGCVIV